MAAVGSRNRRKATVKIWKTTALDSAQYPLIVSPNLIFLESVRNKNPESAENPFYFWTDSCKNSNPVQKLDWLPTLVVRVSLLNDTNIKDSCWSIDIEYCCYSRGRSVSHEQLRCRPFSTIWESSQKRQQAVILT